MNGNGIEEKVEGRRITRLRECTDEDTCKHTLTYIYTYIYVAKMIDNTEAQPASSTTTTTSTTRATTSSITSTNNKRSRDDVPHDITGLTKGIKL